MCSFFICKLKKSCKLNLFAAGFFPPVELARALLACTVGSAGGARRKGPGPRSPRRGCLSSCSRAGPLGQGEHSSLLLQRRTLPSVGLQGQTGQS